MLRSERGAEADYRAERAGGAGKLRMKGSRIRTAGAHASSPGWLARLDVFLDRIPPPVYCANRVAQYVIFYLNHSSGIPVYLQLMQQIRHGVETGALRAGERLPTIRSLAEELVINPNTVVRAYRELEHEGVVELRQGSGAYIGSTVVERGGVMTRAGKLVGTVIERLRALGLSEEEIRRIVESELAVARKKRATETT